MADPEIIKQLTPIRILKEFDDALIGKTVKLVDTYYDGKMIVFTDGSILQLGVESGDYDDGSSIVVDCEARWHAYCELNLITPEEEKRIRTRAERRRAKAAKADRYEQYKELKREFAKSNAKDTP